MEVLDAIEQAFDQNDEEEIIQALAEYLSRVWNEQSDELFFRIEEEVRRRGLTAQVIEEFLNEGETLLGSRFAARVQNEVSDVQALVYRTNLFGALTGGLLSRGSVIDDRMLDWLEEYDLYWLRTNYSRNVRRRLQQAAAEAQTRRGERFRGIAIRSEAGRDDQRDFAFKELRRRAGDVLQGEQSDSYWELVSAAIAVRTQSLSRIESFARMGVEEYELVATIDRVTSAICRHLDGKRFSVADAVAKRDELLAVDRSEPNWPEQVKDITPWHSEETVIAADTEEELVEIGVVFPPFHGHCRTIVEPVLGTMNRGPVDLRGDGDARRTELLMMRAPELRQVLGRLIGQPPESIMLNKSQMIQQILTLEG